MVKKADKKNIFYVVTSNCLTIIINIILCLIFPKIMDIENYALYKMYILYITYSGLFHMGFVNGIYLEYGKFDYDELPKEKFRYFTRVMISISVISYLVLFACLIAFSFYGEKNNVISLFFVAINIPIVNMKCYYSVINQFTKNFVKDSQVTYVQNVLTFIMIIIVLVLKYKYYIYVLIMTTTINVVATIMIMWQNRTLIVGKSEKVSGRKIFRLLKQGFCFMFSEYVGLFVIGIDSIFINLLYSRTEFAMYSFAATIVAGLYMVMSIVSNLIYPYLVRIRMEEQKRFYNIISDIITVITVLLMATFFVLKWIVYKYIPLYESGIAILSILFGIVIFRSLLLLVCNNYFKIMKITREYSYINILALVISFLLNVMGYVFFKDYSSIATASLISFALWYMMTEIYLMKKMNCSYKKGIKRYIFIFASLTVFFVINILNIKMAFLFYVLVIVILLAVIYSKENMVLLKRIISRMKQ